jgi:hypothetical protein
METPTQRPPPLSHLYADQRVYRLGGFALCFASAIVAVAMAAIGWSVIYYRGAIPVFSWLTAFLLSLSVLFWLPFALFFRARRVPVRFALLIGALSPLLASVALGLPALFIATNPVGSLLWLLPGVPIGLLTGFLVHLIATTERGPMLKARGGA